MVSNGGDGRKTSSAFRVLETIFSLSGDSNAKLRETVLFFLAALFMITPAVPVVMQIFGYSESINSIVRESMGLISNVLIVMMIWYLIGNLALKIESSFSSEREDIQKRSFGEFVKRNLAYILICVLAVLICLSTIGAKDIKLALYGTSRMEEGVFTWMKYFIGMFSITLIRDEKKRRILLNIMAFVSLIVCAKMVTQYWAKEVLIKPPKKHWMTGVVDNCNHCAYYVTINIMCFAGLLVSEKRWYMGIIYMLALIFEMWVLILNDTLGCFIAIMVGLPLSIIVFKFGMKARFIKAILPTLLLIIVCVAMTMLQNTPFGTKKVVKNIKSLTAECIALLTPNNGGDIGEITGDNDIEISENEDNYGTGRIGLWKYALKFMAERPLLGYGTENLGAEYAKADLEKNSNRPHNEFLQMGASWGIPALLVYLASLTVVAVKVCKRFAKSKKTPDSVMIGAVIMLGYLISAFFGITMYFGSGFFFLIFGLTLSGLIMAEDNDKLAEQKTAEEIDELTDENGEFLSIFNDENTELGIDDSVLGG